VATRLAGDVEVAINIPVTRERRREEYTLALGIEPRSRSHTMCRIMNVAIATTALIIASPVLLVFAALVKLTSPGPVFYRQARVGIDRRRTARRNQYDRRARDLGGLPFIIYKFRSRYINAEQGSGAVWATDGDPRITPIGRLMRKCRVDELPQLLNVIRGDMNIVGPRPERPVIFSRLRNDIAEYPLRQRARPGITGWAQINHTYDRCLDDVRTKVKYDLEYLARQGVREDLRIMARTVPVVVLGKGW
jgi:lipopolysaccharide/colanic/teichoic acid biosynthesis glycosyltransferase